MPVCRPCKGYFVSMVRLFILIGYNWCGPQGDAEEYRMRYTVHYKCTLDLWANKTAGFDFHREKGPKRGEGFKLLVLLCSSKTTLVYSDETDFLLDCVQTHPLLLDYCLQLL